MNSSRKKSMRDILCCPVCEILPTIPVYGCQNGHVICSSCKSKVNHCAVCRAERFNVRMLVVEELLVTKILPCEYQNDGCCMPLMTGQEYSAHILVCPYRPIECNSKDGISHCQSQSVPHDAYMDHLKEFHGARAVQRKSCIISCDMSGPFTPKTFQAFNETFILYSHRNLSSFWTWVALLDNNTSNHIRYYIKLRLRYQVRGQELKSSVSDVFTQSSVHDLPEDILKSGRCLIFSTTTLPDTAPPCVWPQYELVDDEEHVIWGYDIEIWEECAYRNTRNKVTTLIYDSPQQTKDTQNSVSTTGGTGVPSSNNTQPAGISQNDVNVEDDDDDEDDYDDGNDEDNSEIENEEEVEDMDDSTSVNAVVNCEELTVRNQQGGPPVMTENSEGNNVEDRPHTQDDEPQVLAADSISQQILVDSDEISIDNIDVEELSNFAHGQMEFEDDDAPPANKRIKMEPGEQNCSLQNETQTNAAAAAVVDMKTTNTTSSSNANSENKIEQVDTANVRIKVETGSSASESANTSSSNSRSHDWISNPQCSLL